ncbi:putative transcription factor/ chromatin remodeling BED-type(Zn) family [Helianthus annuus]|nr:putative transcription factor/ chromatin remodeling BED-type(Zn) family [Helianthus annuus]
MASDHAQSQSSVGVESTSSNLRVVSVVPTTRNPDIWQHFDLCEMLDGPKKARCKKCGGFLKAGSNSTLKKHINAYCKMRNQEIWNYDVNAVEDMMAKCVIQENLPFNYFENPRVTKFIQDTLQPRYTQVSRTTLRRKCFKMWKQAKNEMILVFENLKTGVNLTCNVWTAPDGSPDSYLCVTAHWVNPDTWQMMKCTTTFELFGYPNAEDDLYRILDEVITTYKLKDKVFSISFDNVSDNTEVVEQLKLKYKPICNGDFFHSRCVAHVINLIVQNGLKHIEDIKETFKQMLVDIFCSSRAQYHRYMKFCSEKNAIWLGPNWEIPIRWDSTCNMFKSALRQKETLQMFHDLLVERKNVTPFPTSSWLVIQQLTDLLEVLKNATTHLSRVYEPTSSSVLYQICVICSKLSEYEKTSQMFSEMIRPMKVEFIKYFKEMSPVFTCAAALNPTLNVRGVEILLENITSNLNLLEEDMHFAANVKTNFTKHFSNMFEVYKAKYESMRNAAFSSHDSNDPMIELYNLMRDANNQRGNTPYSELESYTATNVLGGMTSLQEFKTFDIFAWWKKNESQFPILAAMARDLLTVQASTLASDSAFSVIGRVLPRVRRNLDPFMMEMCICLKDYLDGVERAQHCSSFEGDITSAEQELNEEELAEELAYAEEMQDDVDDE